MSEIISDQDGTGQSTTTTTEAPAAAIPAEKPTTALALKDAAGQMVTLDYGQDAGAGTQYADLGGSVPFLSVLQDLSKCTKKANEKYIPGAEPGMFALTKQKLLFDGTKGINFIGICEEHVVVEKTALDATGQWVADHKPDSAIVAEARSRSTKKSDLKTKDGHVLVDTFRMYGVVVDDFGNLKEGLIGVVFGWERSKLAARSSIMDRIRMHKSALPLYAIKLRLTTKPEPGKKGDYHTVVAKFAVNDDLLQSLIRPTDPQWESWAASCRRVCKNLASGTMKADAHTEDAPAGDAGGDDIPF